MRINSQENSCPVELLEIFHQHSSRLQAIAYRMLGTITDAEDVLQEAFIKWQQVDVSEINNSQAYLTTIVTRLCLDSLRSARVKREQYIGTWLPEPIVSTKIDEPAAIAEMSDSLSMAFLVILERLSPVERAVFLLREIFEYDYEAIAKMVEKTPTNCRQLFRRAKRHLLDRNSRFTASVEQQRQLTEKFILACDRGDLPELIALLSADITLYSDGGGKVKALLKPMQRTVKVARFLIALRHSKLIPRYDTQIVRVNGCWGIVYSLAGKIHSISAFHISDRQIQSIYLIRNPDKLTLSFAKQF